MRIALVCTALALSVAACAQHKPSARPDSDVLAVGDLPGVIYPFADTTSPAPGGEIDAVPRGRVISPETLRELPVEQLGATTIAPFPVPWDTSSASAERMKVLNLPSDGVTMIAPMPPPGGKPRSGTNVRPGAPLQYRGGRRGPVGYQMDGSPLEPEPRIDTLPRLLPGARPIYPDSARDAKAQGTVTVRLHVLADGSVGEAEVVSGDKLLREAALEYAQRCRFEPATVDGHTTDVWVGLPVRFTLH